MLRPLRFLRNEFGTVLLGGFQTPLNTRRMSDAEGTLEKSRAHSGLHIMGRWGCGEEGPLSLTRALWGCVPGFMGSPMWSGFTLSLQVFL